MSAVASRHEIVCREYTMADVNPVLEKRLQDISRLRDDLSEMNAKHAELTETLNNTLRTIEKVDKIPAETVVHATRRVGMAVINMTKVVRRDEVSHVKMLTALESKKHAIESELDALSLKMSRVDAEKNHESMWTPAVGSHVDYKSLETMVRNFDGEQIARVAPKFNNDTAINERFESFVNDVRRPLITFTINGEKVFDKSKMKDTSDASIKAAVVRDLAKYKLNLKDFYTVLEFFHQGGTTQGYDYYTEQVAMNGMNPKGVGPEATVELQIVDGKLLKLVSTANYVIANIDDAEEGISCGIVADEGKKVCTTVYDFQSGKVNLSVATTPFEKGEIAKIDAQFNQRTKPSGK